MKTSILSLLFVPTLLLAADQFPVMQRGGTVTVPSGALNVPVLEVGRFTAAGTNALLAATAEAYQPAGEPAAAPPWFLPDVTSVAAFAALPTAGAVGVGDRRAFELSGSDGAFLEYVLVAGDEETDEGAMKKIVRPTDFDDPDNLVFWRLLHFSRGGLPAIYSPVGDYASIDNTLTTATVTSFGALSLSAGGVESISMQPGFGGTINLNGPAVGNAIYASMFLGLSSYGEPGDPGAGKAVIWMSNGTGFGDLGDVCMTINDGTTTKSVILVDFSALP